MLALDHQGGRELPRKRYSSDEIIHKLREAYAAGAPVPDLVREYQISSQRVYQILGGD